MIASFKYIRIVLSVFIAFVFIQSLFFKFSDSPETQYIFGTLAQWSGMPWFGKYGAYGIGVAELCVAITLFTRYWKLGAVCAFAIMSAAIYFHLLTSLGLKMPTFDKLGQVAGNDSGLLFGLACTTWSCALGLLVLSWRRSTRQA